MKKYVLFVLVLCLLSGCQNSSSKVITFPFPDVWRNQYKVSVLLDPSQHTYQSKIELTLKNTSWDVWDKIVLRDYPSQFKDEKDGSLSLIQNVMTSDKDVLTYLRLDDPTIVEVMLAAPLAPGEIITISMDYQAYVPELNARFGYVENKAGAIDFYLGNSLPILAVYENGQWVCEPYFSDGECFYSETADYLVTVTVPNNFTVIGTGDKLNTVNGENQKTIEYTASSVRDYALVIGNDYQCVSQMEDGILYNSYYHSANQNIGIGSLITLINETKALNKQLGEYPYQTMNTVETYMDMQGMEYPQLIMIAEYMHGNESTIRHELVHQWFYNIVGNNGYQEAWLDESIATYLAEKSLSEHIGRIDQSYNEYPDENSYVNAMYFCGGSMYTRLANRFGKDQLIAILQDYLLTYAYSQAATKDLLGMLIRGLGEESLEIFKDYFDETTLTEASTQ